MLRNVLFLFIAGILISSCAKEVVEDSNQFATESLAEVSIETRTGPDGCFELVYPISFKMSTGDTLFTESHEDAKAQIIEWKENNPDEKAKPKLVFPMEILTDEGNLISIDDHQELREIVKACKKEIFQNGGKPCFRLVYPIKVEFPNGNIHTFNSPKVMHKALRLWKKQHPFANEKPTLVFPLQIKMKDDGSIITVNSKEDLMAIKADCE